MQKSCTVDLKRERKTFEKGGTAINLKSEVTKLIHVKVYWFLPEKYLFYLTKKNFSYIPG